MLFLWYAWHMKILYLRRIKSLFLAFSLLATVLTFYPHSLSQAASWTISAEEWARPRSGESLLQMESLVVAVQALIQEPMSQLSIRYPGGEEGALWASELKDWLVSLGVPSARIEIRPGQSSYENITLMLSKNKENME